MDYRKQMPGVISASRVEQQLALLQMARRERKQSVYAQPDVLYDALPNVPQVTEEIETMDVLRPSKAYRREMERVVSDELDGP